MRNGDRPHALVVEDEPEVREIWCEFLAVLGWEASEAENGTDALIRLEQEPFDLLVADLFMPGLNGWELAWAARRLYPSMPVVMISGSSTHLDTTLLRQPGIALLDKPVGLASFRRAVEEVTGVRGFATTPAAPSTV